MTVYCLRAFELEVPNVSISILIPFLTKHHSNINIPYHCGDVPMYHLILTILDIVYNTIQDAPKPEPNLYGTLNNFTNSIPSTESPGYPMEANQQVSSPSSNVYFLHLPIWSGV